MCCPMQATKPTIRSHHQATTKPPPSQQHVSSGGVGGVWVWVGWVGEK